MVKNLFVLFILISFSSLSQDSDRKKDFIDLFPNPAKDYINIKLTNDRKLEDCTFSIHSLIGNKMNLDSEVISDNEMRISIGEFNQGFFFLLESFRTSVSDDVIFLGLQLDWINSSTINLSAKILTNEM